MPSSLSAAGAELLVLPAMPAALLQQLPTGAAQLALALARRGPPPPPTETAPCLARDPQVRPEDQEGEGGTTGANADHNRSRSSRGASGPMATADAADGPAGRR